MISAGIRGYVGIPRLHGWVMNRKEYNLPRNPAMDNWLTKVIKAAFILVPERCCKQYCKCGLWQWKKDSVKISSSSFIFLLLLSSMTGSGENQPYRTSWGGLPRGWSVPGGRIQWDLPGNSSEAKLGWTTDVQRGEHCQPFLHCAVSERCCQVRARWGCLLQLLLMWIRN